MTVAGSCRIILLSVAVYPGGVNVMPGLQKSNIPIIDMELLRFASRCVLYLLNLTLRLQQTIWRPVVY